MSSHFRSWSPDGLSNFQKVIAGVKNTLDQRVLHTIGKLLERKCLKWAHMTHLDTSNTSYGQKKGRESNRQIWLPTTKSWESPQFPCVHVMCNIPLESSWWRLQICFRPHVDQRFAHKDMAPQSCESPNFGNFGWVLVSWPSTKYTIRGKVVASHKYGPWWVLWVRVCPCLVCAPKALKLRTNQLVVWFCAASCE
jgi:hypothetical protein